MAILAEIRDQLPEFERWPFSWPRSDGGQGRANDYLDVIVRKPISEEKDFIPVGVVSKNYILIPHTSVIDTAIVAFRRLGLDPETTEVEFSMSRYGERMLLGLFLPARYNYSTGDGLSLALRLECLNSVDGSTGFQMSLIWFRVVCSNGLIVGLTGTRRRKHIGYIQIDDMWDTLVTGLKNAERDRRIFDNWRTITVGPDRLNQWADGVLCEAWGIKAAARALHIASTGYDAEIVGAYNNKTPSTVPIRQTRQVPGVPSVSRNIFDIAQILAWLARDRKSFQEQLRWRQQVGELLEPLASQKVDAC